MVANDGTVVVGGESGGVLSLARFRPEGSADETFGPNGRRVTAVAENSPTFFARAPDGGFALITGNIAVARFLATGDPDPRFDVYRDETSGFHYWRAATYDAQGGIVVAGFRRYGFRGSSEVALYRVAPKGLRDETFGNGGRLTVPLGDDASAAANGISIDAAGRLVVFATADHGGVSVVRVFRLLADGTPDTSFAADGSTSFWDGFGTWASGGAVTHDGRILVNAFVETKPAELSSGPPFPTYRHFFRSALFRLNGGSASTPFETEQGRVVEYSHTGFGHYFVTSLQGEKNALDRDTAWTRTGRTFVSWTKPGPQTAGVCRFFSDQSFAPKSSHFYTPYVHECDLLKAGSVWKHEGDTFHLRMPEGPAGARTCPAGTQPLYRAYNNSIGGAPNHRYMTDAALLGQMVAQGWIMEGEAQTRVFACVPAQ